MSKIAEVKGLAGGALLGDECDGVRLARVLLAVQVGAPAANADDAFHDGDRQLGRDIETLRAVGEALDLDDLRLGVNNKYDRT